MASDDSGPEWILSSAPTASESSNGQDDELLRAARRVWPHVHAHATRALGEKKDDPENATLAAEIWEGVLQSIAGTLHRLRTSCTEISNIDSYLVGTFRHRFYRTRRRQQRREQTIQLVASINELDALAVKQGLHALGNFEQHVLAREIFVLMDRWMRRVWTARRYGYSWKSIAIHFGLDESRVKMKFRYKLSLLRVRLGG
jgi:DNA-directed RNA polymerase specialized sigma24 family protein